MNNARDLIAKLDQKVKEIKDLDEFKNMLSGISLSSHRYQGWTNLFSIYLNKPNANHLATFNQWIEIGYCVKKGEHGLTLFRPQIYPEIKNDSGEIEKPVHTTFHTFTVFDENQVRPLTSEEIENGIRLGKNTNLKPKVKEPIKLGIPEQFSIETHETDFEYLPKIIQEMNKSGITVEFTDLSAYGTSYINLVKIRENISESMKISVAIHEWAHEKLHKLEERRNWTKNQKEFEAEAVAYVVCDWLKIPVKSENYLAHYAEYDVSKSLDRIVKASKEIFEVLK